jgi:hypothetical protein
LGTFTRFWATVSISVCVSDLIIVGHVYEGYIGTVLVKDLEGGCSVKRVSFDFGKLGGGVKNLLLLEIIQNIEGVREAYVVIYASIDRYEEEENSGGSVHLLGYLIESDMSGRSTSVTSVSHSGAGLARLDMNFSTSIKIKVKFFY